MPPLARSSACALAAALLVAAAAPAGAEIYRWKDAAGREHFTTDLQKVPPEKRRGAREAARAGGKGPAINYVPAASDSIPPEDREEYAPPQRSAPAAPDPDRGAEAASEKRACKKLKKEAAKLRKAIANEQRNVDHLEDTVSDIADNIYQEHRRKKWLARAEASLAEAEAEYERWRKRHRRRGAPPGCLR